MVKRETSRCLFPVRTHFPVGTTTSPCPPSTTQEWAGSSILGLPTNPSFSHTFLTNPPQTASKYLLWSVVLHRSAASARGASDRCRRRSAWRCEQLEQHGISFSENKQKSKREHTIVTVFLCETGSCIHLSVIVLCPRPFTSPFSANLINGSGKQSKKAFVAFTAIQMISMI